PGPAGAGALRGARAHAAPSRSGRHVKYISGPSNFARVHHSRRDLSDRRHDVRVGCGIALGPERPTRLRPLQAEQYLRTRGELDVVGDEALLERAEESLTGANVNIEEDDLFADLEADVL